MHNEKNADDQKIAIFSFNPYIRTAILVYLVKISKNNITKNKYNWRYAC